MNNEIDRKRSEESSMTGESKLPRIPHLGRRPAARTCEAAPAVSRTRAEQPRFLLGHLHACDAWGAEDEASRPGRLWCPGGHDATVPDKGMPRGAASSVAGTRTVNKQNASHHDPKHEIMDDHSLRRARRVRPGRRAVPAVPVPHDEAESPK